MECYFPHKSEIVASNTIGLKITTGNDIKEREESTEDILSVKD